MVRFNKFSKLLCSVFFASPKHVGTRKAIISYHSKKIHAIHLSMYLRSTKRMNKDGSVVEYYQLAHNERHPDKRKPVAKIIHNFGRADQLDRQQLVRLCQSIARVCRLTVIDPCKASSESSEIKEATFTEDLQIKQTLALGCPMVIEALWEQLGLKKILQDIEKAAGTKAPYERALFAMVANRLCEPESKLGVWDR